MLRNLLFHCCLNQRYSNIIRFLREECKLKGEGEKIKGGGFKKEGDI